MRHPAMAQARLSDGSVDPVDDRIFEAAMPDGRQSARPPRQLIRNLDGEFPAPELGTPSGWQVRVTLSCAVY